MANLENAGRMLLAVCLIAFAASGVACTGEDVETAKPAGKPVVYTTFYPTRYFAERIGAGRVEVVCPVPADEDAIFWMPDEKVVEAYQKADLIILNGAKFAKWVEKVSLPESRLVDSARPFEDEFIAFGKAITHSHGPAGEHTHEGIDGHTWLDPVNAKMQAGEIKKAFVQHFPDHRDAFEEGFASLAKDLDGLKASLEKLMEKYDNKPILCSHPAYNYIARRFKWNIENLDLDPEEMPDDETFAFIKELLKTHPARYILWESYPKEEIAERFKTELGLESVEFSPCELLGEEEIRKGTDYISVMRQNVENIRPVFAPDGG